MKRLLRGFFLTVAFLGLNTFISVFAQEELLTEKQITLFNTQIEQKENTDIDVIEEIHYYFPVYEHGIIREIPVDYKVQSGLKRPTTLSLNEIYYYRKDNPERKYKEYERSSKSGYAIFKIGDPDITIQGEYVYVINYTLKNAVNYFDDHDELYLNITGNGWNVPIKNATATIKVPGKIEDQICFTGVVGSTSSDCTFEKVNENETAVTVSKPLESFEGYTVALKMPKGSLADTRVKQMIAFLISNVGILLPIPTFIYLRAFLRKKGKNKKITVIPHYEPDKKLYPLLAGYIYSKNLNNKYITAQIIQLAIDGHMKIRQEGKRKYILVKDNKNKEIKLDIPKTLYDGLFNGKDEINSKKISSTFYTTVNSINSKLGKEVFSSNYFDSERKKLQSRLSLFAVFAFILSIATMVPLSFIAAAGWSWGFIISSIITFIFSLKIDLRSSKGNEVFWELEGLKMYINTAEKHRIEFHNDPEKFQGVFETLLPYAIIFGLEKKWANEFKDIYKEPPSWYQGDVSTFNSYMLANSIAGISKNVQSKSKAPNSAGGFSSSHGASGGSGFSGGSSGGGFGGGGGSSW
jgi:uncharacterized membrane protein YgcG